MNETSVRYSRISFKFVNLLCHIKQYHSLEIITINGLVFVKIKNAIIVAS